MEFVDNTIISRKAAKFYDDITSPRHEWEPRTLKEYLTGDNRFKYFTVPIYIKIMKSIGYDSPRLRFITLINDIDKNDQLPMKFFARRYGFKDLEKVVLPLLDSLKEMEATSIKMKYGLSSFRPPWTPPMSLREIGKCIDRSGGRIGAIVNSGLWKLRHPSRLKRLYLPKEELISNVQMDHKFIHVTEDEGQNFIYNKRWDIIPKDILDFPVEQLEEAIDAIGDDSRRVVSVKSFMEYESWIPTDILELMKLPPSHIDRIINYTTISTRPNSKTREIPKKDINIVKPHAPSNILHSLPGDFDGTPLVLGFLSRYTFPSNLKDF